MPSMTRAAPRGKTELIPRFRKVLGDYVCAAEITADGELCVFGTGDGNVIGIELATGRERFRRGAHKGGVLEPQHVTRWRPIRELRPRARRDDLDRRWRPRT